MAFPKNLPRGPRKQKVCFVATANRSPLGAGFSEAAAKKNGRDESAMVVQAPKSVCRYVAHEGLDERVAVKKDGRVYLRRKPKA